MPCAKCYSGYLERKRWGQEWSLRFVPGKLKGNWRLPVPPLATVCLQCGRPEFDSWVGKVPWRRKWQSTPALLPGKSHGRRSLIGYSPWGRKESDTTERLHFLHFPWRQEFLVSPETLFPSRVSAHFLPERPTFSGVCLKKEIISSKTAAPDPMKKEGLLRTQEAGESVTPPDNKKKPENLQKHKFP